MTLEKTLIGLMVNFYSTDVSISDHIYSQKFRPIVYLNKNNAHYPRVLLYYIRLAVRDK